MGLQSTEMVSVNNVTSSRQVFVGKVEVGTLSTPAKASDVMKIVVGGVAARRVRVELLNEYLSLAEVKVYGKFLLLLLLLLLLHSCC